MTAAGSPRHYSAAWCWLAVLTLALGGCSGITVRRAEAPELLKAWRASLVEADTLSPRTLQTLRRWDLESVYSQCPAEACARLHRQAVTEPQPEILFALAEVNYLLGRKAEQCSCADAIGHYYLSAGYAYHYLFGSTGLCTRRAAPGHLDEQVSPYDPRFRLACDLYNAGLAKCLRAAQRVGELDPRQTLHVPTADGKGYTLTVVHHGFAWRPDEFGPLLPADDYEVVGLANQYRGYGLGVPLIGTRDARAPSPAHAFYPREVSFPVTAFFRFEGSLNDLGEMRSGQLELYNPLAVQVVAVDGQTVPLQTDLTTPLAYFLGKNELGTAYSGFLLADQVKQQAGIYMFEPYQPGKIPVVMVHGLLSSPLTWAPLFNDLRADPVLRERFQFWFYLYPTANPFLVTAADLRDTLTQLRADLDPGQCDKNLDQLVLVGHSMGGLVSRLLTVDSGDEFFRVVSPKPIESLKAKPQTLAELQRIFFFERLPCVNRVIFLGTPHHGSKLSPSFVGRIAARFVRAPRRMLEIARDIAEENPKDYTFSRHDRLPTSVDLLAPGSPALELLASQPRPPDVRFHSVIGVVPCGPVLLGARLVGLRDDRGTDGVVPYSSAHLDDVDSELVVGTDHFQVHQHPRAALEVRRILLEHLQTSGRKP